MKTIIFLLFVFYFVITIGKVNNTYLVHTNGGKLSLNTNYLSDIKNNSSQSNFLDNIKKGDLLGFKDLQNNVQKLNEKNLRKNEDYNDSI